MHLTMNSCKSNQSNSKREAFFTSLQHLKLLLLLLLVTTATVALSVNPNVPKSYRALVADAVGDSFADVARVRSVPTPELADGEVLIRVVYAGINGGCETFRARGEHAFRSNADAKEPFRLGAEGVGVVVAIGGGEDANSGDDTVGIAVGDTVSFVNAAFGEYTTCPTRFLWKHSGPPTRQHVGLRISALTSCAMLEGRMKRGDVVLITAAAGGAGHFAVQFAKLAGCTVVGTTSSAAKTKVLRETLGCDYVVNYKETPNVREEVLKICPDGVDVVFEGVGGTMFSTALDVLKPNGILVQVGYISEYPHVTSSDDDKDDTLSSIEGVSSLADLFWNSKTVQRGEQTIYGNGWPKDISVMMSKQKRVLELYEEGKLVSLVDNEKQFHGLESITSAVQHMLSGKTIGKVVVEIENK